MSKFSKISIALLLIEAILLLVAIFTGNFPRHTFQIFLFIIPFGIVVSSIVALWGNARPKKPEFAFNILLAFIALLWILFFISLNIFVVGGAHLLYLLQS
ncbi:MAG: hypothetical protein A3A33_03665 [Candidatus Yanofskybacteria bacterium RIFCSPLOWO2_01_FULL_49_25]|uniref:Uncharacterized protein n=1 Tax=Candidatus Yanofskybacteria bacterium RIFCSPLOWO2_01_FULL_49_25 TaxID=1802701 RepID=A0A1F8GXV9_9BACT|nr:MAG: hypothetical protein A3A33_03665 [Candidatus Yanofskybacteria bacterium RIFCSPLOWO2_01_FULL_49_25]